MSKTLPLTYSSTGILMAEETIYLTISAILATFDILPYEKTQARLELAEGFLKFVSLISAAFDLTFSAVIHFLSSAISS